MNKKNKTIILSITLAVFLCCVSLVRYWKKSNNENLALGQRIAEELQKNKFRDKHQLKKALDEKYHLAQNNAVSIAVLKEDNILDPDILISIYEKPLGPFNLFSLKRNKWAYEE